MTQPTESPESRPSGAESAAQPSRGVRGPTQSGGTTTDGEWVCNAYRPVDDEGLCMWCGQLPDDHEATTFIGPVHLRADGHAFCGCSVEVSCDGLTPYTNEVTCRACLVMLHV